MAKAIETQCCFGKDAWGDRRCANEGAWRFVPYRGCSEKLRTYVFCDAHKSKYNEMLPVAVCRHPIHDTDCPHGCENPDPRCVYCDRSAAVERADDNGRVELVCDQCAADFARGTALDMAAARAEVA